MIRGQCKAGQCISAIDSIRIIIVAVGLGVLLMPLMVQSYSVNLVAYCRVRE